MGNLFSFYDLYTYKLQVSNLARKPSGTVSRCSLCGVGRVETPDCDGTCCACAAQFDVQKRGPTSTWNGMGKCATELCPIRFEVWENEEFVTQTK